MKSIKNFLVALSLLGQLVISTQSCAQNEKRYPEGLSSLMPDFSDKNFIDGAKFGFAAGFFPVVGTLAVATTATVLPLVNIVNNVFWHETNKNILLDTKGLIFGHVAGVLVDAYMIKRAYNKAGIMGGTAAAFAPSALVAALVAFKAAHANEKAATGQS